jgi:hypothetical protein
MKIELKDEVIKQATKCNCNFSCLNDKENLQRSDCSPMCTVENIIAEGMVFVNFNYDFSCNYSLPYGTKQTICRCPVRYLIYKHYKK